MNRSTSIIITVFMLVFLVTTFLLHVVWRDEPYDMHEVLLIPPASSPPSPPPPELLQSRSGSSVPPVTKTFSFGQLVNTYEDKDFGFLFQYPDILTVESAPKGCYKQLEQKPLAIGFLMFVNNPSCPSVFANPNAHSLEDYAYDYVLHRNEEFDVRVLILKTFYITTLFGTKGIRQEYTTQWINLETGDEEDVNPNAFSVRYIFFSSTKGFYSLEPAYSNQLSAGVLGSFAALEKKIADTIQYGD